MAELHEDDLFRQSSMSFGEHLEELRSRLFRAAFWLAGGVIIGFFVGGPVVRMLESPMEEALLDYQQKKTQEALPAGAASDAEKQLIKNGWLGDHVFVQPLAVAEALREKYPNVADPKSANGQPALASDLVPLTIWRPGASDPRVQLQSFNAVEPFMIYLKAALLTGIILASPMMFREIWMFVAAGLYPHERRYVKIFLPLSVVLFLSGVFMGFFIAFPIVLKFLLGFNSFLDINPMPRIEEFWSFALFLPLAFGVGFQLPLVMLFVNRIGLVSAEAYLKQWRIAVLGIFVTAMILMPSPDVSSMALLAVPMTLLYFFGIYLCKYTSGRRPAGLGSE